MIQGNSKFVFFALFFFLSFFFFFFFLGGGARAYVCTVACGVVSERSPNGFTAKAERETHQDSHSYCLCLLNTVCFFGRVQPSVPQTAPQLQQITEHKRKIAELSAQIDQLAASWQQLPQPQVQKQYLALNEYVTREMLQLDKIESDGRQDIRYDSPQCFCACVRLVMHACGCVCVCACVHLCAHLFLSSLVATSHPPTSSLPPPSFQDGEEARNTRSTSSGRQTRQAQNCAAFEARSPVASPVCFVTPPPLPARPHLPPTSPAVSLNAHTPPPPPRACPLPVERAT